MIDTFREFLRLETAAGIILCAAAAAGLVIANTPLSPWYGYLLDLPIAIRIDDFEIAKPLLLWINDGLMALFFLLIGLELKRELLEGHLAQRRQAVLPALAATGGMLLPALIYAAMNRADPVALQGWAIPAATDIAFALAVLALLGKRVPAALRIFLVSVAIFDDIGAIVIIALFYTTELTVTGLAVAALCLPALFALNRRGVTEHTPYLLIGAIMWVAVLKSGVHATLAGVILAMFIPMRDSTGTRSPLQELEHDLHPAVSLAILPLFAFANAGLALSDLSIEAALQPVPLGIAAGLLLGKQLGVFAFCWLGVQLGAARLPDELSWPQLYGAALLCGIGFTMSLFIGSLAFETSGIELLIDARLGILIGSLLSALGGYLLLRVALTGASGAR